MRLSRILFFGLVVALLAGCAPQQATPAASLPTATAGDIALSVDRAHYTVETPIGVTLTNHSGVDYYTFDGRSACSLVQMQQFDTHGDSWVSVNGCNQVSTPRATLIARGASQPITLAPWSTTDPNAWDAGLYRIAIAYTTDASATGQETIAFSPGFAIG